ncbi:sulfite exporter TauE/SafE family protein [Agrococcus versicolor]|uniref:Probable membrane transporter protein n=1 Tax=Agrococcus versicolor TaxID=501482 RepID=A0ABP5M951_9MICO
MLLAAAIAGIVLLGAVTQRIAGIGFGLVASPLLVLLLGPLQGVVLTNVFGLATALVAVAGTIRVIEWRRILPIAAVVAIVPGAILARAIAGPTLSVVAGCLVLAALAISVAAQRIRGLDRWPGLVAAGGLGGVMNVLAGVGGPAVTAYAIASRWEHRAFSTSIQAYLVIVCAASLLMRGTLPTLTIVEWLAAFAALGAGVVLGQWLSRRVAARAGRIACVSVATLGGIAVIVTGSLELLGA